ncbi:hypothetical protein RFI_17082, partial [Reticulomyxa filosa]
YSPSCAESAVVVMNVLRHMNFRAEFLSEIYGDQFEGASQTLLDNCCEAQVPPQINHIIAIACRAGFGTKYEEHEISDILLIAYTGFKAAKLEAQMYHQKVHGNGKCKVAVHTGNWGCGVFGGNVELHSMLQIVAAHMAGIDTLIYHSFDLYAKQKVQKACKILADNIFAGEDGRVCDQLQWKDFIARVFSMDYCWGTPNGF